MRRNELAVGDTCQLVNSARFGVHAGQLGVIVRIKHLRGRTVFLWQCEDEHVLSVVARDLRPGPGWQPHTSVTWWHDRQTGSYGKWLCVDTAGGRWELEYRCDGPGEDSGWYLYGPEGVPFGLFLGRLLAEARNEATEIIGVGYGAFLSEQP